jgi:uncharacterized membrane protein
MMTQKELVKQAKKNIRERNREYRRDMFNFLELWQSIGFMLIGILIVGVVGGSLYSFFVHIDMISGNWEYPYGMTEIVWTGIGALPCVILSVLIVLFLIGLAIYSVIRTTIEHRLDKKRELEEEISKLSKENADESK